MFMECQQAKNHFRQEMRRRRQMVSQERKMQAAILGTTDLLQMTPQDGFVLSYASFGNEFSTWRLNLDWIKAGKLVLPRVCGDYLKLYCVKSVIDGLERNTWGILEPIPSRCDCISPEDVSLAIIPGLAFDRAYNRLGYGKGYYDRFLCQLPDHTEVVGLGFKEQFCGDLLPTSETDIPVKDLALY